ncbi:MAG: rhs element Vgr family protein [Hydrocarboniphaga sp.]|uniref:type VI secretion system tip protein TssI/VgrG n=1 Tax=Hydrocarboniphaga sp. TaxID=2033016 RepID=UPI002612A80E|nr:type VI secretion system tip protein TssI/VgrG [Hydrocarboniphaga sp.]MDB5972318.1 rhs element Vgr family protein [Hydrocarboniphaga sp.]
MAYSQEARLFELSTPLDDDDLVVREFRGTERVSQCFRFELSLVSPDDTIDAEQLITQRVTLRVETAEGERHWTGFIASFERVGEIKIEGEDEVYTDYSCEIVPLLAFLAQDDGQRIFQNKTVRDIVEELFQQFQISDYEFHLSETYAPIEYCVQYQETTLAFIERILERAGIYYFFKHEAERELLVLTDNRDNNPALEQQHIEFHAEGLTDGDVISKLKRRQALRTGRVVMRDFNFEKPRSPIEVSVDTLIKTGDNANYERYRYPGGFADRDQGENVARLLMESEEAEHEILDGDSNVRLLTPGYTFTLTGHPDDQLNEDQLVLEVRHDGRNNLGRGGEQGHYRNQFSVMPSRVQYRPPVNRRRARVDGPHTAIVVGPTGEEIYTDQYGRVKVKFHWDRSATADDKSSCWLRVAQIWAGRQYGAFFLPRIGMEVMVDFLEGDPDRPIVTGCLYNADNMPPYELPAEATKSTIKTNSSKGGGGFNELRFEDKKDNEQLFINAQKDMDLRVGNDRRDWTERDHNLVVNRDRMDETHRSHHAYVNEKRVAEVKGDDHLTVGGLQAIKIGGSLSLKVGSDIGESCVNHSEAASSNWYVNAGANVVIEAGAMITLKVGGSSVTISAAGVTLDGPLAKINCGGSAGSGSAASLVSPMAVLAAAAALTAKPGAEMAMSPLADQRGAAPPNDAKSHDPDAEENQDKTHYIEIALVDEAGQPVAGAAVKVTLPDGESVASGTTDEKGLYKVSNIDPGECQVAFPDFDDEAWEES